MFKTNLAGLNVDSVTRVELLAAVRKRVAQGQTTFIVTPYSEFLCSGLRDPRLFDLFNKADFAVPDGVGLFWAAAFLKLPLTRIRHWARVTQAVWQALSTLLAIVLRPGLMQSVFPERIPGSTLVWDLAEIAAQESWSVYLLGGFGNTPARAAARLKGRFPNLRIAGCSNKDPEDPTIVEDIAKTAPEFLFVAYGPVRQERWITAHLALLRVPLAIGLGGTFDYLAGNVPVPPLYVRQAGFEWLYRLLTQPHRYRRVFNAFFGLIFAMVKYKISTTSTIAPFRNSAASSDAFSCSPNASD